MVYIIQTECWKLRGVKFNKIANATFHNFKLTILFRLGNMCWRKLFREQSEITNYKTVEVY